MILTIRPQIITVVITRGRQDLVRAPGHEESVEDAPNGDLARKDARTAQKGFHRQSNPSHQRTTMVPLMPEPIIGL